MDALPEFALVRATTLDDVIRARANHPASSLLGGGTDLVVNIRRGIVAPPVLIDVTSFTIVASPRRPSAATRTSPDASSPAGPPGPGQKPEPKTSPVPR